MSLETMSEAISRLERAGYDGSFTTMELADAQVIKALLDHRSGR